MLAYIFFSSIIWGFLACSCKIHILIDAALSIKTTDHMWKGKHSFNKREVLLDPVNNASHILHKQAFLHWRRLCCLHLHLPKSSMLPIYRCAGFFACQSHILLYKGSYQADTSCHGSHWARASTRQGLWGGSFSRLIQRWMTCSAS